MHCRTSGVDGAINVNRKQSCHITQEDVFDRRRTMRFSCGLKLGPSNRSKFNYLINNVLDNLKLAQQRSMTPEKLNDGERKRLSIALELVTNP